MLIKETKEEVNMWRDIPCLWWLFSHPLVSDSLQPWGLQHARKTQSFQYVTFSRLVLQIKSNPNQNSNKAFCTH